MKPRTPEEVKKRDKRNKGAREANHRLERQKLYEKEEGKNKSLKEYE